MESTTQEPTDGGHESSVNSQEQLKILLPSRRGWLPAPRYTRPALCSTVSQSPMTTPLGTEEWLGKLEMRPEIESGIFIEKNI